MEFFDFTLSSLNVELMSTLFAFCCLSVDKSRDTAKNIFWPCTVILNYFEIIEYLVSYTSHFKRHTPKISKIWISWKSSDPTGNYHIFSISVVKMTNFDPRYQRCSCDTSNWNQWAWNHYKNSFGWKFSLMTSQYTYPIKKKTE